MLLGGFCQDTAGLWGLVGWVVVMIKIVIPLLLIILGMVDLGKAVVSSDEKAINTAVSTLIRRFIAAVVIFFVPTIVSAVFNAITGINYKSTTDTDGKQTNDAWYCMECLTNVSSHQSADDNTCKSQSGDLLN